jgi:multidrug efflux pump subunit AcrB
MTDYYLTKEKNNVESVFAVNGFGAKTIASLICEKRAIARPVIASTLFSEPGRSLQSFNDTKALDEMTDYYLTKEKNNVESVFAVNGFGFAGRGQNTGVFVRQEGAWQTNEQVSHTDDDNQIQHQVTTGTTQNVACAVGTGSADSDASAVRHHAETDSERRPWRAQRLLWLV